MLSNPIVVPPLSPCTNRVRLRGQKTGSTVTIFVNSADSPAFSGPADGPDQTFTLDRTLSPGDLVWAHQDGGGSLVTSVTVNPQPGLSELSPIMNGAHLYVYGRCGAFSNGYPGAEVTISLESGAVLGRGIVDPETGAARVGFNDLLKAEVIRTSQTICGLPGPDHRLPPPDLPPTINQFLPQPRVRQAIECERAVFVEGILEGATVRLYRSQSSSPAIRPAFYASACFDYPALRFTVADRLINKEEIWVEQVYEFLGSVLASPRSDSIWVKPVEDMPTPTILGKDNLCAAMTDVGVSGLCNGATVTLVQVKQPTDESGIELGQIEAWDETCSIPLADYLDSHNGRYIRVFQTLCGHTAFSDAVYVADNLSKDKLPVPVIDGPLFECARVIRVRDLQPTAYVTIYRSCLAFPGRQAIAYKKVYSDKDEFNVAPALRHVPFQDNYVFAEQLVCGNLTKSGNEPINEILDDNRMLQIYDCGDHLTVSNIIPGVPVDVYQDDKYWRSALSGGSAVYFNLDKPFGEGMKITAKQFLCTGKDLDSNEFVIGSRVAKRRLKWKSTERICQLTGDFDPDGKFKFNDSIKQAGIEKTDLGVVIDHDTGDNYLYLFFGDTQPDTDYTHETLGFPRCYDTIARTADDQAGPFGFRLNFLHVNKYWPIGSGTKAPHFLKIKDVFLGECEVPTGGFSHNGKLYVFATTDHYRADYGDGQNDYMGRSVLASAADVFDEFQIVYGHDHISSASQEVYGSNKFINIAVQKIKNNELPYLPDNASPGGEGLILIGSGRFRHSQPCLAYLPLVDGKDPWYADWRYLSGFTEGDSDAGPCGIPQWSPNQFNAIFLFDDSAWSGGGGLEPGRAGQVGELSIMYVRQNGLWLLLYGGVVLRSAEYPWGPWSEPIKLFDYGRDVLPTSQKYIKGWSAYGPYIIPRFTRFDTFTRELTIYFNMSTWDPYQVVLMKNVLSEDCSYDHDFVCPAGGSWGEGDACITGGAAGIFVRLADGSLECQAEEDIPPEIPPIIVDG